MNVLTHCDPRIVDPRLTEVLARFLARAKHGIVHSCRPVIGALGMSDKPWSAVSWILMAVVLALLFVITFVMFEGSMWT